MRTTIFATTATLLLASAGMLAAQDAPAGQMHRHGEAQHGMMQHCPMHAAMAQGPRAALQHREHLGLSAEQAQRLEAIHQRQHQAHQQVMPQMQEVHRQVAATTEAERFDEQAARAALQRAGQLHTDMMLANLRAQHETRAVLSAQQREQLRQHAGHHGGMHGAQGGHGQHGMQGQHGMHGGGMGMMSCPMMGGGMQHGQGHQHGEQHRHR
jgi:Spy/CpxP family protein refolding chaperone